tara:strand:- start:105 stop:1250 length:1146 start_codon:yes stop_codon:yes gene_type:complete
MFSFKPEHKYKIKLQSPSKSFWGTFKKTYLSNKNLKSFWSKLDKSNLPKELIELTNLFVQSESYNWASKFWRHMIINHYKDLYKLSEQEAFKRIAINDYAAATFFDKRHIGKISETLDTNQINANIFEKHLGMTTFDSISYNLTLLIMYKLSQKSIFKYYDLINKKIYEEYNPSLKINNHVVNQHLIMTILEFEKIKILEESLNCKDLKILEIGAGYGRTANLMLSLKKNIKYIIADLPPSIYISRLNLIKHFPNLKIYSAFKANNSHDMMKIINDNDIVFILPHQLELINRKTFDIAFAIGSLLEMEKKDVKRYMKLINKLSNSLYMKVFENSGLPFSFYQFYRSYVRSDYFIKDRWKEKFNENCIVPDYMVHMGYIITD